MTAKIKTVNDWKPAWDEAIRSGSDDSLEVLARHHFHSYHCGGWEVAAWPCPTAGNVIDNLMGYKKDE